MEKKRYQDCSKIEKFWRNRWKLTLPFMWLWYQFFKNWYVPITKYQNGKIIEDGKTLLKGRELWEVLQGEIQSSNKMNYYWTMEEVKQKLKNKIKGLDE